MSRSQSEIVTELLSLCAQYKAEVPGRSQAWPKSIKERVAELHGLGLGDTDVANLIPVPMQTIYSWRHARKKPAKSESGFLPVKINDLATATVRGRPRKKLQPKISTVTVTTPSGYKIEGLSLGEPLFWKKGRSKSLTDFGQLVFRHCQIIFGELNKIEQLPSPEAARGIFIAGASEPIANYVLPNLVSEAANAYPHVNFNIYTSTQSHLLELLTDGRGELGFFFYVRKMPDDLEIVARKTYKFRLVVKKQLRNKKSVIESFIGSREVDDNSTHEFPTLALVREKYPEAKISFSSNSLSLHRKLVLLGNGISILPDFLVEDDLRTGTLVDVFPKRKFQWDLMVVRKKGAYPSPVAKKLIALVAER